ncbi:MAG TPA: 5'/3'-nucleotidase SurE [Bacteroidales bacterium]|jgi:5'-nucleotidase|nr:5'/3'-nucleotidase SurE [Bacteroidales bacterium]
MSESQNRPLILITNDDGVEAKGLQALIDTIHPIGTVVVVAPADAQSGMSHAITVKVPLRLTKLREEENLTVYKCFGTPVDCVKMALNHLLPRKPDLLLSGINHGSNSAASVFYSGTMGAALEGCINEITSIGFSLLNLDHDADFSTAQNYADIITRMVLKNGLPKTVCLNVNIPDIPNDKIAGIKVCRQNRGFWREEFDQRIDPAGKHYFWLTGIFHNSEPDATDTDEWALNNNFVSVVPLKTDLTCHETLNVLNNWNF